jgi:hypothetical protein
MKSFIPVDQLFEAAVTHGRLFSLLEIMKTGGYSMEKTDADLVSTKPYLSEVLDLSTLRKVRANIIVAPCHSGKTTAAHAIM